MTKFVFDNTLVVEVDALRWVKKQDTQSYLGNKPMLYELELCYRAATGTVRYKTRRERNAMFSKIVRATMPRKKRVVSKR